MTSYADFYRQSIDDRDTFWAEQAKLIDWQTQPEQICDYNNPPFARWFVGGTTNLCHNAIDRHLKDRQIKPRWSPSRPKPTLSALTALPSCIWKCSAWRHPCCRWASKRAIAY